MRTAIGVLARAPLPGRCKTRLLAAYGPEWVAGLCAAMLRDTLDGLQAVTADDYVVFAAPVPRSPGSEEDAAARAGLAVDVLARHVPRPWELVSQPVEEKAARVEHALTDLLARGGADPTFAVLAESDAPSFPTEPLAAALASRAAESAIVGPARDGGYYLLGVPRLEPRLLRDVPWDTPALLETTRGRCREVGLALEELPTWYDVDEPSDVLELLDEIRRHPERAPRTAQFLVTRP